jgi:hypothetical protein
MEINRQNYEMYLLDYIEGQLPENMVLAMLTFLKNNPEIETEANALLENTFVADVVKFNGKDSLKKNSDQDIIGISKFEQLSIAFLENDISPEDCDNLNKILQLDETKLAEHKLLNSTRLKSDLSVVFPNKKQLKRFSIGYYLSKKLIYYSVAASAALIMCFVVFFNPDRNPQVGKSIAITGYNFKNRVIIENRVSNIKVSNVQIINDINIKNTDTTEIREKFDIQTLNNKQLASIDLPPALIQELNSGVVAANPYKYINNDDEYKTLQAYLEKRFKEKVLRQKENEKVTLISVVNAFGRFTKRVFDKKIEVEKFKTEDGESLYAIKTDSYNLYTRNARKKSDGKDLK